VSRAVLGRPWLAVSTLNRVLQPVYIVEAPWDNHSFAFCFEFTKSSLLFISIVLGAGIAMFHFLI